MSKCACAGHDGKGKVLKRADPTTIKDKFMVGYQGWFTCPGDGEPVGPGHHGWLHWFNYPIPDGGRPNTDLWPDVSSYSPSELFPAPGLKLKDSQQAFLFSSRNPKTVQRHFHWMAEYGVDGAFLQRFAGQCDLETGNHGIMKIRDEVGDRVREAAEKEGRVFAIMYDVSGVAADRIQRVIERDWIHLIRERGVLDSPNYLKEKGKPVIALWGFGFENAGHTPVLVRSITNFIRNVTPGGAYIMAGTPTHWRTLEGDADRDPGFLDVWLNDFDAISPWTVGRFRTEHDADHFAETKMKGDIELVKKRNEEGKWRKIDYIPVVLPGGSGYNLSEGKWAFNDMKRNGGRFLWNQIFNAHRLGARIMYGAMWDEYDEGTAFMPVVQKKSMLPVSDRYPFLALDEDGYDIPPDWYMRICGFAAEGLRSERRIHETFPSKELQDYWASRPKFEEVNGKCGDFVSGASSAAGSGGGEGQSYQVWLEIQKEAKDELPPPPYSLEVEEPPVSTSTSAASVTYAAPAPAAASATPNIPADSISGAFSPALQPHTLPHGAISSNQGHGSYPSPQSYLPPSTHPIGYLPGALNAGAATGTLNAGASSSSFNSTYPDPVSNLTDEFSRHQISSGPTPNVANDVGGRVQHVPPPIHPSRPAVGYNSRPPRRPSHSRPTSSQSRPGSQLPSTISQSVYPLASSPTSPRPPSESHSSGVWPPAEWNAPQQQPSSPSHHSYPGSGIGANLSRPNSFSASSNSSGSSLRPHATIGASSIRPSQPPSPGPQGVFAGQKSESSYPSSAPHSPTPYSTSMPAPGGAPAFPSANPPFGGASFPPPSVSPYSSSDYGAQPGPLSTYNSQPNTGYLGSGMPPYLDYGYGTNQASQFAGSPYFNASTSTSHQTPEQTGSPQFPQGTGGAGYFGMPEPGSPSSSQYQTSSYLGQQSGASSPYPPSSYTQLPSPSPVPNTGQWTPGGSHTSPPPLPHRPSGQLSNSKPSGSSFLPASTGASALGFALSAVDKVAGKKTRVQLESQVGSIAQSGSKLFSKFTK